MPNNISGVAWSGAILTEWPLVVFSGIETFGKNAVVCGRSKNVGMPIAMLLHSDGIGETNAGKYRRWYTLIKLGWPSSSNHSQCILYAAARIVLTWMASVVPTKWMRSDYVINDKSLTSPSLSSCSRDWIAFYVYLKCKWTEKTWPHIVPLISFLGRSCSKSAASNAW